MPGFRRTGRAGFFEEAEADASRVRVALEGSSRRPLGGGVFAGDFGPGARLDGGDAEEGAGAEFAAGFSYLRPRAGLEVRGPGSLLLAHEEGGFREWGLGLGMAYDPGVAGRALRPPAPGLRRRRPRPTDSRAPVPLLPVMSFTLRGRRERGPHGMVRHPDMEAASVAGGDMT